MENFNDVTDAFGDWLQTIEGIRIVGSYVAGRWVESGPATLSFPGVVQNATSEDVKVLEEGLRTEESIKIHSQFELVPQVDSTTTGDLIDYDGHTWLVHNVANRRIGGYYKSIAVKQ